MRASPACSRTQETLVVARVGDADSLLAVVAEHDPDLAIVDVRMPPTYEDEGMRAAVEIRRLHPRTGVLVLPRSTSRAARTRARQLGQRVRHLLKDVLDVGEFRARQPSALPEGALLSDPEVVKR